MGCFSFLIRYISLGGVSFLTGRKLTLLTGCDSVLNIVNGSGVTALTFLGVTFLGVTFLAFLAFLAGGCAAEEEGCCTAEEEEGSVQKVDEKSSSVQKVDEN